MPRRARLRLAGCPVHLVQRGNNRMPCFFADRDYALYLNLIAEHAGRFDCAIHAYVLMTNHIHLLLTPADRDGLSRLMRHVGQRYDELETIRNCLNGGFALGDPTFKAELAATLKCRVEPGVCGRPGKSRRVG